LESTRLLVHKIELTPNKSQAGYFARSCGVARFAYNWALRRWKDEYKAGRSTNEAHLRKEFNLLKDVYWPWTREVTKVAPQEAIKDLGNACSRFFKKQGGYPRFKKQGVHDSFQADNGPSAKGVEAVPVDGKRIKLPKIGWVKMRASIRFQGQVKSVTVSRTADKWFASILVDAQALPHSRKNHGVAGVDVGIKTLATVSDGRKVDGPKAHTAKLGRLRRLSRSLSRKKNGSSNRRKAQMKLARLHADRANIRQDTLHKLTTDLVLNYTLIGIENLNVKGMASNRRLSRHVMNASFFEFKRQLKYKAAWYGSVVVEADRFFASTRTCSACGEKNPTVVLGVDEWCCPSCGAVHDRDFNASVNLELMAASSAVSACGEKGSGFVLAA
jgi:putative transposase